MAGKKTQTKTVKRGAEQEGACRAKQKSRRRLLSRGVTMAQGAFSAVVPHQQVQGSSWSPWPPPAGGNAHEGEAGVQVSVCLLLKLPPLPCLTKIKSKGRLPGAGDVYKIILAVTDAKINAILILCLDLKRSGFARFIGYEGGVVCFISL